MSEESDEEEVWLEDIREAILKNYIAKLKATKIMKWFGNEK